MTDTLLLIIIVLFGLFFAWQIFNYCRGFKQRYFNAGAVEAIRTIIRKAKEGKSFKIKDEQSQDEIKLIMLSKKNAKSISRGIKRPR